MLRFQLIVDKFVLKTHSVELKTFLIYLICLLWLTTIKQIYFYATSIHAFYLNSKYRANYMVYITKCPREVKECMAWYDNISLLACSEYRMSRVNACATRSYIFIFIPLCTNIFICLLLTTVCAGYV